MAVNFRYPKGPRWYDGLQFGKHWCSRMKTIKRWLVEIWIQTFFISLLDQKEFWQNWHRNWQSRNQNIFFNYSKRDIENYLLQNVQELQSFRWFRKLCWFVYCSPAACINTPIIILNMAITLLYNPNRTSDNVQISTNLRERCWYWS